MPRFSWKRAQIAKCVRNIALDKKESKVGWLMTKCPLYKKGTSSLYNCDVCLWPKADIRSAPPNVRSCDPKRTSKGRSGHICCGSQPSPFARSARVLPAAP